jgi:hypothetical protein
MYEAGRDHPWNPVLLWGACAVAMATVAVPGVVARPAPVLAQQHGASQQGPLEYISRGDQRVIRAQVEVAIRAAEMAVETLGRGTEDEDLTRAKAFAAKSYILLRYAMHGVELVANDDDRMATDKLMARMALTAINKARMHNLAAQRALDNSIPSLVTRGQYVEEALQDLTDLIPVARRAAVLLLR